jgi:hypothetical protein
MGLITAREDGSFSVSERTIARRIHDLVPVDPSGPWSLADADADPEEARLILDVVAYMDEITDGRIWLTRNLAHWIARVRRAAPTVPAEWAYGLAWGYQSSSASPSSSRCLDLVLGIKPWERELREDQWDSIRKRCRKLGGVHADAMLALARWRAIGELSETAMQTAEPLTDGR